MTTIKCVIRRESWVILKVRPLPCNNTAFGQVGARDRYSQKLGYGPLIAPVDNVHITSYQRELI